MIGGQPLASQAPILERIKPVAAEIGAFIKDTAVQRRLLISPRRAISMASVIRVRQKMSRGLVAALERRASCLNLYLVGKSLPSRPRLPSVGDRMQTGGEK